MNHGSTEDIVLLLDTNRITILGKRVLDFHNELINIYLDHKPKGVRLISIPIPVRIKGSLYDPEVKVLGKKSFFRKSSPAFGRSLINPSAWIIPYMSTET